MVGYIYKITNKVDGRFYIGSTINFEKRKKKHINTLIKSKHHNLFLQRAFNKYGIEVFDFSYKEKKVQNICELQKLEERYINFCWSSGRLYNVSKKGCGGDLISYHPKNKEFKELQSKLATERYANMSYEDKKEMSLRNLGEKNPNYGNKWADDQKKKASERMKNNRESFFYSCNGKTYEELFGDEKAKELKENLSKLAKEKKGEKNPFYGKKHTDETKLKISKSRKGIVYESICKKVLYNGIIYNSASDCARQLGLKNVTVSYRAKKNIYGFSYVGENDFIEQNSTKIRWTKEECEKIAKQCKTKNEFYEKSSGAYNFSKINGLLEEFSKKYFTELRHYWTLEELIEISKKYESYSDFRKNEPKAYSCLCRHTEWLKIIKNILKK